MGNAMPVTDPGPELILESHEDRLQRMEVTVQQTHVDVVRQGLNLENLERTMDDRHVRVLEKMDEGFKKISEQIQPLTQTVSGLTQKAQDTKVKDEVAAVEKAAQEKFRAPLKALLLVGAGAIVSNFGVLAFKWLTR